MDIGTLKVERKRSSNQSEFDLDSELILQVFIRQGNVIQAAAVDKSRRARIVSKGSDQVRQCYLFTNHMLLCNRTSAGKLHLIEGKFEHLAQVATYFRFSFGHFDIRYTIDVSSEEVSLIVSLVSFVVFRSRWMTTAERE